MKKIIVIFFVFLTVACFADDTNSFYGTWVITKPLIIKGRLGDINKTHNLIKDFSFVFSKENFMLNDKIIIDNPYYDKAIWNEQLLFDMTKGSAVKPVKFADLEIDSYQTEIISITIKEGKDKKYSGDYLVPGLYFFVINDDTVILNWEDHYFLMRRK